MSKPRFEEDQRKLDLGKEEPSSQKSDTGLECVTESEVLQSIIPRHRHDCPIGSDAALVELSMKPSYAAFPSPWLTEWLEKTLDSDNRSIPELLTTDIKVGKNNPIYFAHFYPTKVPPEAIMPFIARYTEPGDVVLDAFCGTGMTGVAAQFCAHHDASSYGTPGGRRAILVDLGVAPSFIASVTNRIGRLKKYLPVLRSVVQGVSQQYGHLCETAQTGWIRGTSEPGRRINLREPVSTVPGWIEYTIWSDVVVCPSCGSELVYWELVFRGPGNPEEAHPRCSHCEKELDLREIERVRTTVYDPVLKVPISHAKRIPVLINYSVGSSRFEKVPDLKDLQVIEHSRELLSGINVPVRMLPEGYNTAQPARSHGMTHVHHFFSYRNLVQIAECLAEFSALENKEARQLGLYLITGAIQRICSLNRYMPSHDRHVGPLSGTLYVAPLTVEIPAVNYLLDRISDISRCPDDLSGSNVRISTQSATMLDNIPDASIDFVFVDPPFGGNLNYSELNTLVEAWLGASTSTGQEAIINEVQRKGLREYQALMEGAFREISRTLKPGRYIVVEFHNTNNSVWRAIQEAIWVSGLVVLHVATLDKTKGTTKQLSYSNTMKKDLVITAYKPKHELLRSATVREANEAELWSFVDEHLARSPIWLDDGTAALPVADRTAQVLFDKCIAYFLMRGLSIPLNAGAFFAALAQRYPSREGLFFLPGQTEVFDRKRVSYSELKQLSLFVDDEASAIQWLRRELHDKPRSFQDLQPDFMKEVQAWAKHEQTLELIELLEQNFIRYDGDGPVPAQIHSYLSSNYKNLRNKEKDDPALREEARDRWFVPDPGKQTDLEKLREKTLLKEFQQYKELRQRKLKTFRTEAVRAGFKAAYDSRDFDTIIKVAEKLPENVLQEDEKLLMYFDVASMLKDS